MGFLGWFVLNMLLWIWILPEHGSRQYGISDFPVIIWLGWIVVCVNSAGALDHPASVFLDPEQSERASLASGLPGGDAQRVLTCTAPNARRASVAWSRVSRPSQHIEVIPVIISSNS
jgi:hypothetical protein